LILGRDTLSGDQTSSGEIAKALGSTASRVVAWQGKKDGSKLTPSLLVLQAKTPLVEDKSKLALPKASMESHDSGH